jgi:hypothetical protein
MAAQAPGGAASRPGVYDARAFGLKNTRDANQTAALQAAIDACHAAGGGTVYVPPGSYLAAGILLKSHVALYLETGAAVYASTRREDYPQGVRALIAARKAEHIAILGGGALHGQGTADLRRRDAPFDPMPEFRPMVIRLDDSSGVTLRDFSILYSDSWACHLNRCQRVVADGLTIRNNFYRTNSDGIDPDSCQDVRISNCHISAGDDCICLKTNSGIPCQDVTVTNCTLESVATAIKLGTASDSSFRNIAISNCTIRNSTVGVGFFVKDGGTIEGVAVSNLAIETLREPALVVDWLRNMIYPLFIDIEQRTPQSRVGAVRDVLFSNIRIASDNGILMQGMPESIIENVTLRDILFRVTRPFPYGARRKHAGGVSNPKDARRTLYAQHPSYCTLANMRHVTVDNLRVSVDPAVLGAHPRSALALINVRNAAARSVHRDAAENAGPVVEMNHCREAAVTNCVAPAGTEVFLKLRDTPEEEVALAANDFRRARRPVES